MTLYPSLVLFHICTAVIGLISGAMSMIARKGSSPHRIAGNIFFVSMLMMAGAGTYLAAFLKPNVGNLMGGVLTIYLVSTAWVAAKRREKTIGVFDIAAFLAIFAVAAADTTLGVQAATSPTGLKAGYPAPIFFIFGTIAALFTGSDLKLIVQGGVEGARRIARHLWRMCLALFLALFSFYPSRARLFSKAINDSNVMYIPHVLLAGAAIYWMFHVLGRRKGERHAQHEKTSTRRGTLGSVAHDGAA